MKKITFARDITLAEIKAMAEDYLIKANSAEKSDDKTEYEDAMTQCINHYTFVSKNICYDAAKKSGNPMHYAVTEFFFPIIRLKETRDKEHDVIIRSIIDAEKPIDLSDMHKALNGIGHDTNWIHTTEKFNYYLCVRAAERVGATIKSDAYRMTEIARQRQLGKNPCSNTQLLKTLQTIITEMLGEGYKVTSHDVNYLIDVYANDDKRSKTGITAANHKTLRTYLKKVCYRVLTNGKGYDVSAKELKDK